MEQHLTTLASPNSWATQVEVAAAASLFRIPVYYCSREENGQYKWNVVKPLTDKRQRPIVKCPILPELDEDITMKDPTHFELLYFHNSHYDAIVSAATRGVSTTPPPLSTSSAPTTVINLE